MITFVTIYLLTTFSELSRTISNDNSMAIEVETWTLAVNCQLRTVY